MKIRNKFTLTFIIFAFFLGLIGVIEHQYINKIANSFRSLESDTAPALTALLESVTAARRASIKSVEYSMRGKPKDRDKALEALQQLDQHIQQYLQLPEQNIEDINPEIMQLKNHFISIIQEYLEISEGPAVKKVFEEEEKLQKDRQKVIQAADDAINQVPDDLKYNLLLIKSESRKVSIKLIEFTLRGLNADRMKAEDAIKILLNANSDFSQKAKAFPQITRTISDTVASYIETASEFLELMSSRKKPVDFIYQKEEVLHKARKELIKTLYPLINKQYQTLEHLVHTTHSQLSWSSKLQLYSSLTISLLAVIGVFLLSRVITTPLNKLNHAAHQIGEGNLDLKIDINSSDEIGDLSRSFQQMTFDLKRHQDKLEQNISLRTKELKELCQTEERLENAQHIAHIGNWELDLATSELHWSDEIFRIFEIDKKRFGASYDAFLEAIHPDDSEKVSKAYEDSLKNKTPYSIEHRLLMQDGSVKYVVEKCETTFSEDGTPMRSLGTMQDITERKHNESLSHRMNRMFEHSIEEIYIFEGEDLDFLKVSRGALENLGYSMQEMSELTPVDIKPEFTEEQFRQYIELLHSGKEQQLKFETKHQRKDGSTYPVEVRLQYAAEDVSPVYLAIIEDLTERKKIEAELESHRLHLEKLVEERTSTVKMQANIIDQTNDSVITVDLNGNITSWNSGAERLFKIPAEAAMGKPILLVYPENSEEFLQKEIVEPVKEKGAHKLEVQLKRGDGSVFPAHLSLSMLYDIDENPIGMVAYSIDLSEQKNREQKLLLLTRQLQDSNRELEAFSYSVSHDLRSPLRSIDGFSLAIVEDYGDQLDDTGKDYLDRVRKAAQRMGLLIDELLDLSRVNRAEMKQQKLNLNEIAQHSFDELKTSDPERQVELLMDDNMQIQADARLFGVIMDNLVGNAWKFTAGQKKATITIKSLPDQPDVFYIKDNGVGFDMRHADKLFGVFQRLHQVKEFPGTGIGLATVQRIIHRHGGKIWAESEPGKGATFFFTLNSNTL